jgi:alkanesulfonate monooxygenase SsuD/methylene tetrahydromethanopterin reductase-like flavin-dependent oxidoreductase (luciferase family)
VSFAASWSWPKPVQSPHPPVLVGGNGPRVLDRVVAYGDEWAPGDEGEERMLARLEDLRCAAAAAGRPPVPTTVFVAPADPTVLTRYEEAGVHRAVYVLPSLTDRGEIERELDALVALRPD